MMVSQLWNMTSDNWMCDMVRWVILHAVPCVRKSLHLENTQGILQSRVLVCNSGTCEMFHGWNSARDYMKRFDEHECELRHLPWPVQSPDLNIAEPVWSVFETTKRLFKTCKSPFHDGLWLYWQERWSITILISMYVQYLRVSLILSNPCI
jgi:hypothetical protein